MSRLSRRGGRRAAQFLGIALLVVGTGLLVTHFARTLRAEIVRRHLPDRPAFAGNNAMTRALFAEAEGALGGTKIRNEALARLAELYHAHLYLAEAVRVYAMLAEREPDDYRWPYLQGVALDALQAWEASEKAYLRAGALNGTDADLFTRLASLQLTMGKVETARLAAARAFAADSTYPPAATIEARLAATDGDWARAIEILEPVAERHPRYSEAHKQLARAYEITGRLEEAARHRELGTFGEAVEPPLLREIYERSVPAILHGNAARGPALIKDRCVRCHTLERTFFRPGASVEWWGWTIRRMQRLGGRALLTDDEAADIVAYLAGERPDTSAAP